ncbi:MAG: hypothetical protein VB049_05955 [Candidatus Pelethousia sp.]|nr:hypothetical protein [Candidatus Pelethousia sp.]
MRFYVASGLENRELAKTMISFIQARGHLPVYDWTVHGDVRGQGEARLMDVAAQEYGAVREAEFVFIMLPGGCGTHTELGIALGSHANKRIVLWSATGREFQDGPNTCVFYHHRAVERIVCPFEELMQRLNGMV